MKINFACMRNFSSPKHCAGNGKKNNNSKPTNAPIREQGVVKYPVLDAQGKIIEKGEYLVSQGAPLPATPWMHAFDIVSE